MPSFPEMINRGAILIAQSDRFNDLGGRFRQSGPSISTSQLILAMIVCAGVVIALWAAAHWHAARHRQGYRNFHQLFAQLCRLHDIDWSGRRLLSQLARAQGLDHPAQLFLMPERFEPAVLPQEMQPCAARVSTLREQIFADGSDREMCRTGIDR